MGSFGTSIQTGDLSTAQPATADREWAVLRPWHALRRSRRALAGLFLVLLIIVLAVLAPVVGRYDPTYGDFAQTLAAPTADHPAGTDGFGRDVLARVLYGYRVSIVVAFASVIAAVALGLPLGLLAGYFGGLVDNLIMRPLDLLMAFPAILLAVALIAVVGTGTQVVALALAIIYLPIMARVLRGSVISTRGEEYVDAANAIGATPLRVMLRHVIPNSIGPLVVQASISMGIAILIEASLSFIGLGTQPPNPSLGSMLAEGRDFMRQAPWVVIFPGLAIMLAVLSFNLLGDGLHQLISPARR
jgi:peptide/nickel transport system permease protein